MKTIGLIGGMSWESTALYYELINKEVNKQLGKLHFAKIILVSVDLQEIVEFQSNNEWDKAGKILADASTSLEKAGADLIILCTNTMHKVVEDIMKATNIPFLHIADPTINKIKENGMCKVGLLGTKFTMEQEFYKDYFKDQDIELIIPSKEDRDILHEIIYTELCYGIILSESKRKLVKIIHDIKGLGAQAIILACTEISLLIKQNDIDVIIIDTLNEHSIAAAKYSLDLNK